MLTMFEDFVVGCLLLRKWRRMLRDDQRKGREEMAQKGTTNRRKQTPKLRLVKLMVGDRVRYRYMSRETYDELMGSDSSS